MCDFLVCGSYVSCQVRLKVVQLTLCEQYVYYVDIGVLMSSHVETH